MVQIKIQAYDSILQYQINYFNTKAGVDFPLLLRLSKKSVNHKQRIKMKSSPWGEGGLHCNSDEVLYNKKEGVKKLNFFTPSFIGDRKKCFRTGLFFTSPFRRARPLPYPHTPTSSRSTNSPSFFLACFILFFCPFEFVTVATTAPCTFNFLINAVFIVVVLNCSLYSFFSKNTAMYLCRWKPFKSFYNS